MMEGGAGDERAACIGRMAVVGAATVQEAHAQHDELRRQELTEHAEELHTSTVHGHVLPEYAVHQRKVADLLRVRHEKVLIERDVATGFGALEKLGLHRARADRSDTDAGRPQLLGEALAEAQDVAFRRGVDSEIRLWQEGRAGREVHDAGLRGHVRQAEARNRSECANVQVHHAELILKA